MLFIIKFYFFLSLFYMFTFVGFHFKCFLLRTYAVSVYCTVAFMSYVNCKVAN